MSGPKNQPQPQDQVEVPDLIQHVLGNTHRYSPAEIIQELVYSFTPVDGVKDFGDIDGEVLRVVIGPHSTGKTSLVHQAGAIIGAEVVDINFGGTVQEDLHGLPEAQTENGTHVTGRAASKLAPPFYRKPNSKNGLGIFLVNELFSGSSLDHQLVIRMWAGGKLDELSIQPGWFIVGTTNPPDPAYLTVQKIDASTASRMVFFPIRTTAEDKLNYWRGKMHELVYRFLVLTHVKNLNFVDGTDSRIWWNLAKEIAKRHALHAPPDSIINLLKTHINPAVAAEFSTFIAHGDDPYFFPFGVRQIFNAEEKDWCASLDLALRWCKDGQTPLLGAVVWDITSWIKSDYMLNKKAPEAIRKRLAAFMVLVGTNGYAELAESVYASCRNTNLQAQLLDLTRETALGRRLVAIHDKFLLQNASGGKK